MAFCSCFCHSNVSLKIDRFGQTIRSLPSIGKDNKLPFSLKNSYSELFGERVTRVGADFQSHWSFLLGSRITIIPKCSTFVIRQNASGVYASCLRIVFLPLSAIPFSPFLFFHLYIPYLTRLLRLHVIFFEPLVMHAYEMMDFGCSSVEFGPCGVVGNGLTNSQIASSVFSVGTVAVLPFYTLMVLAPKANLTRKSMESTIPYIVLGVLYAYLLYLSWTPDTLRLMFASKYLLPELPGMAKMFSSEMTLASAWIHLLAVDLFAARQVFQDGLENEIETRHSVSLCLLFCPVGILAHVITRALTNSVRRMACK